MLFERRPSFEMDIGALWGLKCPHYCSLKKIRIQNLGCVGTYVRYMVLKLHRAIHGQLYAKHLTLTTLTTLNTLSLIIEIIRLKGVLCTIQPFNNGLRSITSFI